jgi:glucan phosphoethanolaminetransferase (alkaline phosphatase superfamily)
MSAHKKREPTERIGLRVIVYGAGTLIVVACVVFAWLVYQYNLLPSPLYRLVLLLVLFGIVAYVPIAIKQVYEEVGRRTGQ